MLLILCGPSGAGKSTLCSLLLNQEADFSLSVSCTTRAPRGQEVHGREYWFVTTDEFERQVNDRAFAEYAQVHGNWYGTLRTVIDAALAQGRSLVFDIDYQGAQQLRAVYPDAVSVMVLPPDMATLEARLRGRGTDSDEVIERRLKKALHEIQQTAEFDYVLVNEQIETAWGVLQSIVCASRHRSREVWPSLHHRFAAQ
ncbi:MAG: guanylate kinase [Myxococcales bacterium]|nr:guanylate kinase [Myxococcales bacterium]